MHYYVLPGAGIYGGVKKGFHCAAFLSAAGSPCVVALPEVSRPTWFETDVELVTHAELAERCRPEDTVLFSCPADAPFVDGLAAERKIVHMQGASTRADVELFDPARGYEPVSHGLHMTYELQRHGRVAPYVPLGVPEVFRWDGEVKRPGSVAIMPRKGSELLERIRAELPAGATLTLIDGCTEAEVAECLKSSEVFLAISPDEAFGLPPLEAMCAECCVVGFPGIGGFEHMRHRETAHVIPNGDVVGLLAGLRLVLEDATYRGGLRASARRFSDYYTLAREREYLLRALGLGAAEKGDRTAAGT